MGGFFYGPMGWIGGAKGFKWLILEESGVKWGTEPISGEVAQLHKYLGEVPYVPWNSRAKAR